jgi:hypothetical protein
MGVVFELELELELEGKVVEGEVAAEETWDVGGR